MLCICACCFPFRRARSLGGVSGAALVCCFFLVAVCFLSPSDRPDAYEPCAPSTARKKGGCLVRRFEENNTTRVDSSKGRSERASARRDRGVANVARAQARLRRGVSEEKVPKVHVGDRARTTGLSRGGEHAEVVGGCMGVCVCVCVSVRGVCCALVFEVCAE
jgi:hypothetical protein